MSKKWLIVFGICWMAVQGYAQQNATIREYSKTITTYPFNDPNPIPAFTNIYPYFRYDGFTDKPIQKEWKVVELENAYIKLTILPQIGGKIWSATEKATGRPFVYENHVVKFRDVAMRGPWTSGGIEPNYGIMGHTPNTVTPVDYLVRQNSDGSVSCIISVLDLLTRTTWTMEVNLPKDKAYFTTKSFWYNSTTTHEPYYHWMNTGIKTKGNLQYIFPGTHYLGHQGEYSDWPINKQKNKDISFYNNNDFGGYKSYHVFGKYTDFFGAYWHDDDMGMARYSGYDDKAGKKIWIWGLSPQGMIWEKLLTDTDGQYSEIQSGRLFNQTSPESTFTPFKHKGFEPGAADVWTEYWYPVLKTKGFVQANNYGALNVRAETGWLKIAFSPVQTITDTLTVKQGATIVYQKKLDLAPLKTFTDSVKMERPGDVVVTLGNDKMSYNSNPGADSLSRPLSSPTDVNWNTAYGLYVQGKELMDEKAYPQAEEKLKASLKQDHNFLPALVKMTELLYRNMRYTEALELAKRALSIDSYDGGANYYYGNINAQLNHTADAKDGFDIAALSTEYRSAAYHELGNLYLREKNYTKALEYAGKAIDINHYDISALQVQAIAYRHQHNQKGAEMALSQTLSLYPLDHFARFEKYLWDPSAENKAGFISMIRNEQPVETYLELASMYHKNSFPDECQKVLQLSPVNALVTYWLAFLQHQAGQSFTSELAKANSASPAFIFPFRPADEEVLTWAMQQSSSWKPKYYLALLYKDRNRITESKNLFAQCGNEPDFAPFYAARAAMVMGSSDLTDLKKAIKLETNEWRYCKLLGEYYVNHEQHQNALATVEPFYRSHPDNYIIGMLYAKTLLLNKRYAECAKLLTRINIIPFEGATIGRDLYREAKLMLAIEKLKTADKTGALKLIDDAKQWPINLGVGKPYPEDIDERMENWMIYLCYIKQGKEQQARECLKQIVAFKPQMDNTVKNFLPANHLITAWATEKLNGRTAAANWLNEQIAQYPDDQILLWCKQVFESRHVVNSPVNDAGIRLTNQLMNLK
jgi:tetratricopeptide (TPR) repeat protein